jgi:hypothetical protein
MVGIFYTKSLVEVNCNPNGTTLLG